MRHHAITVDAILVLLILGGVATSLQAQQPPYDVFPSADPPYYRVRYEASTQPGELVFPVNFTLWIPPGVETLRGIVIHQHGCGEGSCKSGLTGAYDLHWQALAKKHDCALLAPSYEQPEKANCQLWCDPRNGSDAAFQQSLTDLGAKSEHPELALVPWALWGHSGGGHWAGRMLLLHPERVVTAWLRSGVPMIKAEEKKPMPYAVPEEALRVPVMCNLGTREGVTDKDGQFAGVWPGVEAFFTEMRAMGALIAVAVDPLTAHECGNQRYLAIRWLDACLTARLPERRGDPLKPMPSADGRIAPLHTGGPAVSAPVPGPEFAGLLEKSVWLPNQAIAEAWLQYVKDTEVTDPTPPPAPTNLQINGNQLTWEAEADPESGLAGFIIERDGKFLAKVPGEDTNPYGRSAFQGLQYSDTPTQPLVPMQFIDREVEADESSPHQYRVIAINTVGLKSE